MAIDAIGALRSGATAGGTARAGGSGSSFAAALEAAGGPKPKTVYQELDEYVRMTPAQRMRADLLKKLGLTEEELANMPPEQRQTIEEKIAELMQRELREAQVKQQAEVQQAGKRIDLLA